MKLLQSHIGNDDSRIVWHEEAKVTRIIYPELFLTAVGNIISNAQKFTKQGGIIDIILTKDALIIRDNGIGISKKDLLHIFDRLYKVDQARTSGTGHGLGLSISKKILEELHHMKLTVESEVGKGTSFSVKWND